MKMSKFHFRKQWAIKIVSVILLQAFLAYSPGLALDTAVTPSKERHTLAPYYISSLVPLDEKEVRDFGAKVSLNGRDFSQRLEDDKTEWVKRNLRIWLEKARDKAGHKGLELTKKAYLNGFLLAFNEVANKVGLPDPAREEIGGLAKKVFDQVFPDAGTSPGIHAVAIGPSSGITEEQHRAYNAILRKSFEEGTYEIREVNINGRIVSICIHYGLEDRILEYNETVRGEERPRIPPDIEVHPGRGGPDLGHGLFQFHISGNKYFFFEKAEREIIARHELAHIDIANGIKQLTGRGLIDSSLGITALTEQVLQSVHPVCAKFIRQRKANPHLNEEDFVDSLPGCDTRTTGIRKKFRDLEDLRTRAERALAKLEKEENVTPEDLDAVARLDGQLELGRRRVREVFERILREHEKGAYADIREYIQDYLANRAVLDYITKTREIASSDGGGFDVYIFVSTSKTEAEFWQWRFEATKGEILPRNSIVLSVYSEGDDRWRGKTDNGSASLYAFTLADELLRTRYMDQVVRKYGKEMSLIDILKEEKPVMMMLMAGKATRMQPLAANNKSATLMPAEVHVDGEKVPMTVAEAVARTFGPLAESRGGRLTEAWGDQINLPGEDVTLDRERPYAVEIFNTVCPFQSEKDRANATTKGVLLPLSGRNSRDSDVRLREKPPVEEIEQCARHMYDRLVADLSLGFNSYRWEFLQEILSMYESELRDRMGHFNIDSELWTPLTSKTAEEYAEFMWIKHLADSRKALEGKKITPEEYDELISDDERRGREENWKRWWEKIRHMQDRFEEKYGHKYRLAVRTEEETEEGTREVKQGVIGRMDYGFRDFSTDWWDFGQIRSYYESIIRMLRTSPDIDKRKETWAAKRMRRYFGIRNKDDWRRDSFLGECEVSEDSMAIGCNILRGKVKNSILVNVTAEEVNVKNAIVIGSTVYKLDAWEGYNIVQNVISDQRVKLKEGEVLVSHFVPGQGQKTFKVNWRLEGSEHRNNPDRYDPETNYDGKAIFDNPMNFRDVSTILTRHRKEEQDGERQKVLREAMKSINIKRIKYAFRRIERLITSRDKEALERFMVVIMERGLPGDTIRFLRRIIGRFEASETDSRTRSELIFFCELLAKYGGEKIGSFARTERGRLLRGDFGTAVDSDIFRRDSVRGVADTELMDPVAKAAGTAYVLTLGELRGKDASDITIAVGRDSRVSSKRIFDAFIGGCLEAGADVIDATNGGLELTSMPLMCFGGRYLLDKEGKPVDGIVEVTASHLPGDWNGFKPTNGDDNFTTDEMARWLEKTYDVIDQEIRRDIKGELMKASVSEEYYLFLAAALKSSEEWIKLMEEVQKGNLTLKAAIDQIRKRAEDFISSRPFAGLKLVADSGQGTMGPIIGPFLRTLGAELKDIGEMPDFSVTKNSNPNDPDVLRSNLVPKVIQISAHLGMGFDVDGDRLGVVMNNGEILRGDDISCLMVPHVIAKAIERGVERPIIVTNVLCSDRLKKIITENRAIALECPVGFSEVRKFMRDPYGEYYRYFTEVKNFSRDKAVERLAEMGLKEGMRAEMGVQVSSHIMFRENFDEDDAFFAVVKLLDILKKEAKGGSLPEDALKRQIEMLSKDFHTGEWRTPVVSNMAAIEVVNGIKVYYEKLAQRFPDKYKIRNTLDGVKVEFWEDGKNIGFLAVRTSRNSPVVVVSINSLVDVFAFNIIKNHFFVELAKYRDKITWGSPFAEAGRPATALMPAEYHEQASALIFKGETLPMGPFRGKAHIPGTSPGTSAITRLETKIRETADAAPGEKPTAEIEKKGYLVRAAESAKGAITDLLTVKEENLGRLEILQMGNDLVLERYKIADSIESDDIVAERQHVLFIEKGRVEVVTVYGEEVATLYEGMEYLVPADIGKYRLEAVDGPAIVYMGYTPSVQDRAVNTTFQMLEKHAEIVAAQAVDLFVDHRLYKAGSGKDIDGTIKAEQEILKKKTGADVRIVPYNGNLGLGKAAAKTARKGSVPILIATAENLRNADLGDERVRALLAAAKTIPVPDLGDLQDKETRQGWFFAREIEGAALLLAATKLEDIEKEKEIAEDLRKLMSQLTGKKVSMAALLYLMPFGEVLSADDMNDPKVIARRLSELIKYLLIDLPMKPYNAEDELNKRREFLWSA